ncbi:citrate lyase beta chain [Sulfurimonas gotlandica GD1]|jgi:citrate lyase subunit beta/citryl-CoA lyase|uniref:Citrate lyase beta chain n=1 Tax=Sulfurimonas gotlandica (strain DSM 19862 / JCM 16533 / GD1) TaxID=929558 RepID=B6BJM3_SULGG|nr:aldolase/citrate lyase family protein [Sulfurimonas gotlandica]EDZ62772.1 HpcH/HpaI aldolase [Sulfurimonas gotlandica GD1]EHP31268.1 citrate lyase beta chain [Sulfurimonas gotlandica GD1]
MLSKIEKAFQERDLVALDALAEPTFRILNKRSDFRSVLMLSCNNLKHLNKIENLDADCIMLNLEDGVSKEDKHFALVLCAIFLTKHRECSKKLVVRVNALDEGGYEEITYLNQFMPDAIRVPKIKNKKEVDNVLALLNEDIELHLSIETSEAWHNLATLKGNLRVTTFYLGILDLFADMKLSQSLINLNNPTMLYMLSHFLITSRAMKVKPVSFVYQEFKNLDEFSLWIELEKSMGYDSKGCISPDQVKLVNEIFVDEEAQINRAKVIVKLFEMHRDTGVTGFVDEEYGFVDEPIYKGALALLNIN